MTWGARDLDAAQLMLVAGAVAQRLSARTRRQSAKVRHLDTLPFGERLSASRWRFGNGLLVVTLPDHSAPVVSYQSWFGVGSRHEEPGKTGLAHFFEHLMFTESKNVPHGDFDRRLEEAGAENNAATWTDWTYYYENLPAGELSLAIELEADRIHNLVLRRPQVDSEREVVASERRDRVDDDVEGKAAELLWQKALGKHPYQHPTIGWMRDIQRYSLADCRRFYRRWYAPNNLVLSVAGHFDERSLLEELQARYGSLRASRLPAESTLVPFRRRVEKRVAARLSTSTERVLVAYPAPAIADQDWTTLAVLSDILFSGRSSRLYKELVLETELCSQAWGDLPPFALPSLYQLGAIMRPGKRLERALRVIDRALKRVTTQLVTTDEIERATSRLELALLSQMETASGKAEQLGFYQTTLGDAVAVFGRLEAYRAISPETVRDAARRFLRPTLRTVLEVRPR